MHRYLSISLKREMRDNGERERKRESININCCLSTRGVIV